MGSDSSLSSSPRFLSIMKSAVAMMPTTTICNPMTRSARSVSSCCCCCAALLEPNHAADQLLMMIAMDGPTAACRRMDDHG